MTPECSLVQDDLADLVAGDSATIARHADHLASCDDCRDARHDVLRNEILRRTRQLVRATIVQQHDFVVVCADRALSKVGDDQVHLFTPALFVSVNLKVLAFSCETYGKRRFGLRRDPAEYVRVG